MTQQNNGIVSASKTVLSPCDNLADQGYILSHVWNAANNNYAAGSGATHPKFHHATSKVIAAVYSRLLGARRKRDLDGFFLCGFQPRDRGVGGY